MVAIETRGLSKRFPRRGGEVLAVRGLDLRVEGGERLAFIGPNGAGKSTSIKMLTGILRPSGGEAEVLGLVPWDRRRALALRIGTLFGQRSQLWSQLPPRATLELLARIYRLDAAEGRRRIDELAALLDAGDLLDRPARSLSLGQRMRCELAASLVHRPEVLFLDEPTIGLDLIAKQRFRELVLRLNEERGTTILLTSHDVADIEQVAERVVIVNHGLSIYDDSVPALRRDLLSRKLVDVHFAEPQAGLPLPDEGLLEVTPTRVRMSVDTTRRPVREVLDELIEGRPVADISVLDPPLEDVIGRIYTMPRD